MGDEASKLTSFGFHEVLQAKDEPDFTFSSLISRVKSAFAATSEEAAAGVVARQSELSSLPTVPAPASRHEGKEDSSPATSKHTAELDLEALTSVHQDGKDRAARTQVPMDSQEPQQPQTSSNLPRTSRNAASRSQNGRIPTLSQRSSVAPPSVATAATHAMAHNGIILPTAAMDDMSSVGADDGEDASMETMTFLRRGSTVEGQVPRLDPYDPSALHGGPSVQAEALMSDRSIIPGFPLSNDILADDTHSIHSSSSRFRLDTIDEPTYTSPSAAQAGLQTSADAIYRRMKGLSMSRKFWMADESAKECRECLSVFTPFRRKHHCRVCGQIFCSRCASNIIPGSRLGHEGVIRVCNFCTRMLSEYEREERSKHASKLISPSSQSSGITRRHPRFPTNGRVIPGMISGPLEAPTHNPLSEFTANNLFPRTAMNVHGNASAIGEVHGAFQSIEGSRPSSPSYVDSTRRLNRRQTTHRVEPAPFRKGMTEEEDGDNRVEDDDDDQGLTAALDIGGKMVAPTMGNSPMIKHVTFPETSPTEANTPTTSVLPRKVLDPRARLVSDAAVRAFRHSRLRSRPGTNNVGIVTDHGDPPLPFRESTFGLPILPSPGSTLLSAHLGPPSLSHLRRMLEQTLVRASVGAASKWLDILVPLVVRAVVTVRPNPRGGEGMDIRQYVKVKRIPGGTAEDTHYVDGFVLFKHVATKKMARMLPLSHARVLIVTFALDYHRDAKQYASLEPLISQEHEYIRILVARLTALRPHIIVAEKTVSRLALNILENAGIVVVHNVKTSAIEAIARCTQADIVPSLDRLALEPRLGRCSKFAVDTYEHAFEIGRRKSFMTFSGLSKEVGCTIVVRGGDADLLHRIKAIAILMIFVGYNLWLEEHLMRDEGAQLAMPDNHDLSDLPSLCKPGYLPSANLEVLTDADGRVDIAHLHRQIRNSLLPYEETILSASASVSLPPPFPLIRLKAEGERVLALKRKSEVEETKRILIEEAQAALVSPTPAAALEVAKDYGFPGDQPAVHGDHPQSDSDSVVVAATQERTPSIRGNAPLPNDVASVLRSPEEVAEEGRYHLAEAQYLQDTKEWMSYATQSQDAVSVTPFSHQQLVVVAATVCNATQRPCVGPSLHQVEYYGFGDETLGHFLEHLCNEAMNPCPVKGCDRQNVTHFQSYVHNETRLQVMSEQYVCPVAGEDQRLLMWSYCKVCEKPTPITVTSEETWSLSFAKYLELHFYPSSTVTANQCEHGFFRDHIRFFAYKNIVVRFHSDDIEAREIVVPTSRLRVIPELQAKLKNAEAMSLSTKSQAYWDSVACRIKAIGRESEQDRDIVRRDLVRAKVNDMIRKCANDRQEVEDHLVRIYKETSPLNVLCFNIARRSVQDKVVQWDHEFAELEKYLPSEKDIRRLTTSHLKRIFAERDSLDRPADQLNLPPAAEVDEALAEGTFESGGSTAEKLVADALQVASGMAATPCTHECESELATSTASTTCNSPGMGLSVEGIVAPSFLSPPVPARPDHIGSLESCEEMDRTPTASGHIEMSRPDYSSCTENESMIVLSQRPSNARRSLSNRFASGAESGSDANSLTPAVLARQASRGGRPPLRKVKTDDTITLRDNHSRDMPARRKQLSGTNTPLIGTSRASSPTRKANEAIKPSVTKPSTSPTTRSRSSSVHRPDHNPLMSRRPNFAPPTSYRQPKSLDISKRDVASARQAPAKDALDRRSGRSATARTDAPTSRGTSRKPSTGARTPTTPASRNGYGTKSRVSTIARHFDRINREAEREREHQRNLLAIRQRRARPVGLTQATVEVFSSVREATKDDESDMDTGSESGSAADNEDNNESDAEGSHLRSSSAPKDFARKELPDSKSVQSHGGQKPDSCDILQCQAPDHTEGGTASPCDSAFNREVSDSASIVGSSVSPVTTLPAYLRAGVASDADSMGTERKSLLNTLSGLWAFRSSEGLPLLDYPLLSTEHVFSDSKIILREDEPTSIIAFTLSSRNYSERLRSVRATRARVNERSESIAGDTSTNTLDEWDIVDLPDGSDIEASLRRPEGTHVRFEFASENTRFYCKIYWAEQFDALRRKCACEESLIESLARCVKWNSSGGKSGAFFIKTRDDRLVVKQLSKYEADAFSTFAPSYFQYLAQCLYGQRPTTLAKIFGCFRIGYRNPQTGKHFRIDCLVTENLFYGREMSRVSIVWECGGDHHAHFITSQIYDLKGSTRNRHMQETGRENEVLLDENLIEQAYQSPLFVREHSKRLLRAALFNDSLFLSEMNVMDYSLVVGVDKTSCELVVGIIDFVRTYTWDKRVESFVKETALLGGGGKGEPTIITPRMYRGRFLSFMNKCFVLTPDAWLPDAWKVRETAFSLPTNTSLAT